MFSWIKDGGCTLPDWLACCRCIGFMMQCLGENEIRLLGYWMIDRLKREYWERKVCWWDEGRRFNVKVEIWMLMQSHGGHCSKSDATSQGPPSQWSHRKFNQVRSPSGRVVSWNRYQISYSKSFVTRRMLTFRFAGTIGSCMMNSVRWQCETECIRRYNSAIVNIGRTMKWHSSCTCDRLLAFHKYRSQQYCQINMEAEIGRERSLLMVCAVNIPCDQFPLSHKS
jgi:hypothetical protein